jgi:hypothetical protein
MTQQQQTELQPVPDLARELSEQAFNLWRHHPVSALFLQYLADYREALARKVLEEWLASGNINPEARGRILAVRDMEVLGLPSIQRFYGVGE